MSRREHGDPQIEELNIGEAAEPEGRGTGERYHVFPHMTTGWCQSSTADLSCPMLLNGEK